MPRLHRGFLVASLAVCLAILARRAPAAEAPGAAPAAGTAAQAEHFEQHIRPILVAHCYECHAGAEPKGGLRLDSQSGWQAGGESGPVIVIGKPAESLLVAALKYDGLEMPPTKKLPADVVAHFETWIRSGAFDPRAAPPTVAAAKGATWEEKFAERKAWWSFQPIRDVPPPPVEDAGGATHPIDRFLRAKLAAQGLAPNPPADRRTRIRRLYFDLLGLPPTYEEVAAFVADDRPAAWTELVDRVLARPEYGQRWGRHWLDVARYADTVEQSVDGERRIPFAHTYRDYVVEAFNSDKPFDRFVLEQVAADRLPADASPDLRAMGFLTVGRQFQGNAEAPQLVLDDRIDVVSRGFMGLTVACARCHDHKFDAISAADYYSLYGIFASSEVPLDLPAVNRPADEKAVADYQAKRQAIFDEYEAHIDHCHREVNRKLREWAGHYLKYVVAESPQHRTVEGFVPLDTPNGYLAAGGSRRWQALLAASKRQDEPFFRLWHRLFVLDRATFAATAEPLLAQFLATADQQHASVVAAFRELRPQSMAEVAEKYGAIIQAALAAQSETDRAIVELVYGAASPVPVPRSEIAVDLKRFLTDRQFVERSESDRGNNIRGKLVGLEAGAPFDRARVLAVLPTPYDPHVLLRGDIKSPAAAVPRRFLSVLAHVDDSTYAGDGRLELARAIVDRRNPLTARVLVNRVWQQHFGTGIVASSDNFGRQGEAPSHPELLDHLATYFMDHGWSVKALHRYILTSQAWQQSGAAQAKGLEVDPANRLVWRATPRRLEFEPLRDALLFVAGRLDTRLGGPGQMLDDNYRRRAIYGYTDRFRIPALLRSFDVANPDTSISRRSETLVPQQALFLMNASFVRAQAKAIAERLPQPTGDAGSDAVAVAAYRTVFARDPSDTERALAAQYLANLSVDDAGRRRLANFVQALLLTNEFTFVD